MVLDDPPDIVTSSFPARKLNVTSFDFDLAGGDPEHFEVDITVL
ncbi:hypothetical protein ES705_15676 [subsurface metagenome]